MGKRLFDIFCSSLGLIILAPLLLFIALWIKKDSAGPVFFRQTRVGLHGSLFKIHKFRSMYTESEAKGKLTIGSDSRITPSGHFIRKYKLDELAQLIDVFLGKMSLVGPRPEVPDFMQHYSEEDRNIILSVKPGITDKASIEMVDENDILSKYPNPTQAYIDIIMPIKAKFYKEYVAHHTLMGDIQIIFQTIIKIIRRS